MIGNGELAMKHLITRLVELVVLLLAMVAAGAVNGAVASLFGSWWLILSVPVTLTAGILVWVFFRCFIDRHFYSAD